MIHMFLIQNCCVFRFAPYSAFAKCRICKSSVHQAGSHYCQGCAYKKGECNKHKPCRTDPCGPQGLKHQHYDNVTLYNNRSMLSKRWLWVLTMPTRCKTCAIAWWVQKSNTGVLLQDMFYGVSVYSVSRSNDLRVGLLKDEETLSENSQG